MPFPCFLKTVTFLHSFGVQNVFAYRRLPANLYICINSSKYAQAVCLRSYLLRMWKKLAERRSQVSKAAGGACLFRLRDGKEENEIDRLLHNLINRDTVDGKRFACGKSTTCS